MNYSNAHGRNAVQQYGQVAVQSRVESANPHHLIQMLLDGALEKINMARGHLAQGNVPEKGANISWAISIIEGLRVSLDMEAGEIAENLDSLYDYMGRRLTEANMKNDVRALDEVGTLLRQIKEAWQAIGEGMAEPADPEAEEQEGVSVGA
jgi:flagellar protein FliS